MSLVRAGMSTRSEEHTSELQSQSNLVCRLLLEKKKRDLPIRSEEHTPKRQLTPTPEGRLVSTPRSVAAMFTVWGPPRVCYPAAPRPPLREITDRAHEAGPPGRSSD